MDREYTISLSRFVVDRDQEMKRERKEEGKG